MDRLKALRPATRASRPKDVRRPARAPSKRPRQKQHKKNVIYCRGEAEYTCQSSLLILLNAKSYHTLRPVSQDDSQRSIEFDYSIPPGNSVRRFDTLIDALCCRETLHSKLPHLDALQQNLIDALQLLHSHNISFPVSTSNIGFLRHCRENWNEIGSWKLYLLYNKRASWASDQLPSSWKTDQLACAESIFFLPKLLTRLAATTGPTMVDFASQLTLAEFLEAHWSCQFDRLCFNISPLTAVLAHRIAYALVTRSQAADSRDVLESFFGGPLPLPEPGTPPDKICETFSNLRARAVESGNHSAGNTALDHGLEAKLLVDSPGMVTRFIICRAEVSYVLRQPDRQQWYLVAMDLYDAFLASEGPSSGLERVCAWDLRHYRPYPDLGKVR